jgi:succinate dehydrogenase/fumarate reductase iron-sulfur protein
MKIRLRVRRLEPRPAVEAEFQTFDLDLDPEETVAGALEEVQAAHDPSLAFRFVCNMKKCGECAVMVNQKPVLACQKKVQAKLEIEPLPNLPLIKDLVIDRHRVLAEVSAASPALRLPSPGSNNRPPSPLSLRLETCLACLICQAMCPTRAEAPEKFIGPLGLVWLAQRSEVDPANQGIKKEIDRWLALCQRCGNCWKYCPTSAKGVVKILKKHGGPGASGNG